MAYNRRNRPSCPFFFNWLNQLRLLPREEAGEVLMDYLEYASEQITPPSFPSEKAELVFSFLHDQEDYNRAEYYRKAKQNSLNAGGNGEGYPTDEEDKIPQISDNERYEKMVNRVRESGILNKPLTDANIPY